MLTSSEEIDLLIRKHINLARTCANKFWLDMPPDVSCDDLFAAALEGLWRAARYWNPERAAFSTYAYPCMRRCMVDWLRRTRLRRGQKVLRERQHQEEEQDAYRVDPRSTLDEIDRRDEADVELTRFEPLLAGLLRDHFIDGYTMKEIAQRHQMPYMTVVNRLLPFRHRAGFTRYLPKRVKRNEQQLTNGCGISRMEAEGETTPCPATP